MDWMALLTAFIAAMPAFLTALAAFIQALKNSQQANLAAAKAEEAAVKAADNADKTALVATALDENTRVTVQAAVATNQVKQTVQAVQQQTNGIRERLEAQLAEAQNTIASLRESIGALKAHGKG